MIYPCTFTDEVSLDFDEAVRICAEEEISSVQIRHVGAPGRNVVSVPDGEVRHMMAALRRYGVRVAGIGSPFGKCACTDEAFARHLRLFDHIIELATLFETQMVRVFAFYAPEETVVSAEPLTLEAALPEIVDRLCRPVQRAQQEGLLLALENEYTTLVGSCREARRVVDAVDNPALRICWDVASGWYTGEPIFPDGYGQIRGLICDVHVRDATAAAVDRTRHGEVCRLGDGAIPWTDVVRHLRDDGYAGPLTLETHLYQDDPEGAPKLQVATRHGMHELRRLLATS